MLLKLLVLVQLVLLLSLVDLELLYLVVLVNKSIWFTTHCKKTSHWEPLQANSMERNSCRHPSPPSKEGHTRRLTLKAMRNSH